MKNRNREPWNFCETPKEKCTMNYCDENGCQNRKRNYVQGNDLIADFVGQSEQFCECDGIQDLIAGTGQCRKCGKECTY
jgi:hypothetical protein